MLDALAAAVRALLYAGVLSMVGLVLAELTLRPGVQIAQWLQRMMRRAAIVTLCACLFSVLIFFLRLGGQWDEATVAALTTSSVGAATGLQMAGALLLLFSERESTAVSRLGNAAIVVASFAFNGHAAVVGIVEGLVAAVHVTAAAWWLGSLMLLQRASVQNDNPTTFELLQRFSILATRVVGALVIAGLILVAVLVDFRRDPWLTPYVTTLAIKIGIAALVLMLAAYNKWRLTARIVRGDQRAVQTLRGTVACELTLIAAVLITTAILTTYTSPHE